MVEITKSGVDGNYNGSHSSEISFLLLYLQIRVKKCPRQQFAEKQPKQANFTFFFTNKFVLAKKQTSESFKAKK